MLRFSSSPFLAPEGEKGSGSPGSVNPDAAPQSKIGEYGGHPNPMDVPHPNALSEPEPVGGAQKSSGESESGTDRGGAGSAETAGTARESIFRDSQFPDGLDPALKPEWERMRSEAQRLVGNIPDAQSLQILSAKAELIDTLMKTPEFLDWADSFSPGEGGEATPSAPQRTTKEQATTLIEMLQDEDLSAEEKQGHLQAFIDRAVDAKVTPLAETVWTRETESEMARLRGVFGEEVFNQIRGPAAALMERFADIGPEEACKIANHDRLVQLGKIAEVKDTQARIAANMEGGGSQNVVEGAEEAKSYRDAFALAERQVAAGGGFPISALVEAHRKG